MHLKRGTGKSKIRAPEGKQISSDVSNTPTWDYWTIRNMENADYNVIPDFICRTLNDPSVALWEGRKAFERLPQKYDIMMKQIFCLKQMIYRP